MAKDIHSHCYRTQTYRTALWFKLPQNILPLTMSTFTCNQRFYMSAIEMLYTYCSHIRFLMRYNTPLAITQKYTNFYATHRTLLTWSGERVTRVRRSFRGTVCRRHDCCHRASWTGTCSNCHHCISLQWHKHKTWSCFVARALSFCRCFLTSMSTWIDLH